MGMHANVLEIFGAAASKPDFKMKKSARFVGTFSSRALLASLSRPRARHLIVAIYILF